MMAIMPAPPLEYKNSIIATLGYPSGHSSLFPIKSPGFRFFHCLSDLTSQATSSSRSGLLINLLSKRETVLQTTPPHPKYHDCFCSLEPNYAKIVDTCTKTWQSRRPRVPISLPIDCQG